MPISPAAQYAVDRLMYVHGLSREAATGLVGTFMQESGGNLNTGAHNPNDPGGSFGIGQWNRDRLQAMRNFQSSKGAMSELDRQIDFAVNELQTTEGRAWNALRNARTVDEAAQAAIGYERPAGWSADNPTGGHGYANRLANAQALYGSTGGSTGAAYAAGGINGEYTPSSLPPEGLVAGTTSAAPPSAGAPQQARTSGELEQMLLARFPNLRVTSRDRSPEHNRKVGGAKGSQHLHGTAIDIGMSELTPQQRQEVAEYARSIGARGFGYYPKSNSMHFDVRQGPEAFWGSNYSRSSLGQTPEWFQNFAKTGGTTGAAYPERAPVNGIPGGYAPSELPAAGLGGQAPNLAPQAPQAPAGVLAQDVATTGSVSRPAPSAPYSVAPNSDAARMLSDPTRYGLSLEQAAEMRRQLQAGGPGGGTIGNIPAVPSSGTTPPAPVSPPAGALSPGAPPPPRYVADDTGMPSLFAGKPAVPGKEPTPEEREATKQYLAGMGPGPVGIWNPEKIWWQRPGYAQPAQPPMQIDPNAVMTAQAPAPIIGERPDMQPGSGGQGATTQLFDDWRNKRPLGLFGGGWT